MDAAFSVPWLPPAERSDDLGWLAAARRGEAWALGRLYDRYHPAIYALCHRLLGRAEDAEDATQSTFVRAFRQLGGFRGECSARTWLYRIAVNESLGLLRRRRLSPAPLDEESRADDAPQGTSAALVERLAVQAALARTGANHRAILVLRYWEGLSYQEIAGVLQISLPATKMRLRRAREEFRRCYEERA
jgi:RNA polymerase sigma-70 factor (ECF subfamily)